MVIRKGLPVLERRWLAGKTHGPTTSNRVLLSADPVPGIVVDTSVFISALRSKQGASYRLLELGRRGTPGSEYVRCPRGRVRDGRQANKPGIPDSAIDDIVDTLCGISRHHTVRFRLRPEVHDPNDEFVLDLAFVSRSDFIVTRNIRHFRAAERFGMAGVLNSFGDLRKRARTSERIASGLGGAGTVPTPGRRPAARPKPWPYKYFRGFHPDGGKFLTRNTVHAPYRFLGKLPQNC